MNPITELLPRSTAPSEFPDNDKKGRKRQRKSRKPINLDINDTVDTQPLKTKNKSTKRSKQTTKSYKPRKASKWLAALKTYNKGKQFFIPKKGSKEYEAVRKLM